MILPTKHISPQRSLLAVGAIVLEHLGESQTLTRLWGRLRTVPEIGTFERFVLALDLLYALGALELSNGVLSRRRL